GSIAVSALATSLERLLGDRLTRVTLGPLDHHSAVRLACAVNPALDPRAAEAVADRSGGWPFWCELLAEARNVDADVERIVADRLSVAGTDAAVLFETIALLGRQAPVEDLIAIRGWPEDRLTAARAELMATGLVVEEGGALRIVHDLVRAAVDRRSHRLGAGRHAARTRAARRTRILGRGARPAGACDGAMGARRGPTGHTT